MSSTKFVFFRPIRKNKMAALACDLLRLFRLLHWHRWTEFTGSKIWMSSTKRVFYWPIRKTRWPPWLWLAETFLTFPLKLLKEIQRNLTESKILMSSIKFVFFGPIGKTRWPPWPLISWDIFNYCSDTAKLNSTKLDGKQDLNILYQAYAFRVDQRNKIAALDSWLA